MRAILFVVPAALTIAACAQSPQTRFIEVLATDSVHLPFAGMDYEVRMPSPLELAGNEQMDEQPSEKTIDRVLNDAGTKARAAEERFLAVMASGGYTFRKTFTEHTEDYQFATGRTFDVNTYRVELSNMSDMERFNALMESEPDLLWTPKDMRYGPPAEQAARLMRKLYDQARMKAEALVAVAGGKLGMVISAQEVKHDEGSFLEQLFKMDKMGGNDEETLRLLAASHTTTMSFRFELLDR